MGQDSGEEKAQEKITKLTFSKVVSLIPKIMAAGFALLGISNLGVVYENLLAVPNLSYEKDLEEERLINHFDLKDGELTLHPQLVIHYNENIIKIISLIGVYEYLQLDYQTDNKQFSVPVGKWESVKKMAGEIKEEIVSEVGEEFRNQISIRNEVLVRVEYQNLWRQNSKFAYYYVDNGIVYRMEEDEALKRVVEIDVNLGNYRKSVDEISNDCVNIINGLDR